MLDEHYGKYGQEIADVLGDSNYSIDKYLDDANYIINNGTYTPELNGYVSFMSFLQKINLSVSVSCTISILKFVFHNSQIVHEN